MPENSGLGVDFHVLQKGKILFLGGIKITEKFGAVGDSDADVVFHSLSDAILAAIKKGDIGTYFNKKKNIKSIEILEFIIKEFLVNRYKIQTIQLIILLEYPPLLDKKREIKHSLSKILKIKEDDINIQAKTFQGLLPNIVACIAFVTLKKIKKQRRWK
jgi:2-C-methyl-D-erythritol 2,4-cyclodiphosphate synthase